MPETEQTQTSPVTERFLEAADLLDRIRWLLLLRCVAMPAMLILFSLGRAFLGISVPWYQVVSVALVVGTYNYAFYAVLKRRLPVDEAPASHLDFLHRHAALQIVSDLIALTLLLYFSGGARNPFAFFFVFHMIFASILLPRLGAVLATALAIGLYSGLAALEATGTLLPYPLFSDRAPAAPADGTTLAVAVGALALTLMLVTFFSTSLTQQLRRRARELSQTVYRLEHAAAAPDHAPRLQHILRGYGSEGADPHARLLTQLSQNITELEAVVNRQLGAAEPERDPE